MTSSPVTASKVFTEDAKRFRYNPYDMSLSTESCSSSVHTADLLVSHESVSECGSYTSTCDATSPAPLTNAFSPAGPIISQEHGNNATNFMSNMVTQYLNALVPQPNFLPPRQQQQQQAEPHRLQQQNTMYAGAPLQVFPAVHVNASPGMMMPGMGFSTQQPSATPLSAKPEKKVRATVQCRFCGEFHNQRLSVHLAQCTKFPGRKNNCAGTGAQRVCGFCQETLPAGMTWKDHNMGCTRPIPDPSSAAVDSAQHPLRA